MRDEAKLRENARELQSVPWFHSMKLLPDLEVQGIKSAATLELERAAIIGDLDLSGRSVLDVGSWNGFYAFAAKQAGAARVTATDRFVWEHAEYRGRETFDFARECLDLDIDAVTIDPTEFPGQLEVADVVFFLGVFYHLRDPIAVLDKVARMARECLVLETHQDLISLDRPAMMFYPRDELAGDNTNWWGPNPECVLEMLNDIGFSGSSR